MRAVGFDSAALDPTFKAHAGRGIGRYVRELQRYFVENEPGDMEVLPFSSAELLREGIINRLIDFVPVGKTTLRQQIIAPSKLRALEFDLIHFPAHIDAPAWGLPPYVVTVLDLIPLIFEDLYKADRPDWRFRFARSLEIKAIENALVVIAISANTASDVHEMLGIPEDRIVVTPLGVDERFFEAEAPRDPEAFRSRYGIPLERKIVLYVGGIDQRKNCRGLLEVVRRTVRHFSEKKETPPVFVMAGRLHEDEQFPVLQANIEELGLLDDVVLAGFVSDEDLLSLYGLSSAFLFASFYEGFGLPVLEAMAAGIPVLSSNRSSLPEVTGSDELLYNPNDFDEGAGLLVGLLADDAYAKTIGARGQRRAREFTWTRTGELTLEAYYRALSIMEGML